jgi:hypothetical protein
MRKIKALSSCLALLLLLGACSPRDYLTRRLAGDLIAGSSTFRASQQFELRTGILSSKDYPSPDYLVLQHHGWISATNAKCPPALSPSPCWEVTLTPLGVDTFQNLIPHGQADKQLFSIPAAHRELVAVTGISKQGNAADVEFTWHWTPLNEVGAALYPSTAHYRSTARFREYDDGWRVVQSGSRPLQPLDESLKNADPAQ